MRDRLEQLIQGIENHPSLTNPFYQAWMTNHFEIEALKVFARNYGAFVKSFPDVLATLFTATDNTSAKVEYVKTLYSEMGYGDPRKIHSALLDNFFQELAAKLGREGELERSRLEKELPLLPSTERLIEGEMELYGNKNPRVAVGAQLAQEWQAYTMLSQLYEGARNYLPLWSNKDGFHEACEYFYAHIGAAEKEHKEEAFNAALQYTQDEECYEDIAQGFNHLLNLFADFWQGIYKASIAVKATRG